jgi:hypothetical protein
MLSFQLSVEVSNLGALMAPSTYTARASQMNNCKAARHRRGGCADLPCRSNRPQQTKPTFCSDAIHLSHVVHPVLGRGLSLQHRRRVEDGST